MESTQSITAEKLKGTRYVSSAVKEFWVLELMQPLERRLLKTSITPNMISFCGLALTCLSAVFLSQNALVWGGWFMILGGCCDFLDGRIARLKNLSSHSGAFLDSVLDRYMDFFVLAGLAVLFWNSWVVLLVWIALLGSTTTPYIKAKSESLGIACKGGEMQRPERIVLIGIGSLLSGYWECLLYPWLEINERPTPYPLILGLLAVAVASNKSAFDRFIQTYRVLDSK